MSNNYLLWRHNGHGSISNHQPHDCLHNRLFRRRSKKTSKLSVTGLCAGNSPGTSEFPAQMASNAEDVSIWWRHHVFQLTIRVHLCLKHTATQFNINILTHLHRSSIIKIRRAFYLQNAMTVLSPIYIHYPCDAKSFHYHDVIMSEMASQTTSEWIVYTTFYSSTIPCTKGQ